MKNADKWFWVNPETLWSEVKSGNDRVCRSRRSVQEIVSEFHGAFYSGHTTFGETGQAGGPYNHAYAYITAKLPELVYNTPRALVRTRRADLRQSTAEPMRFALNRWAIDNRVSKLSERLALDVLTGFGVAMCTLEPNPGMVLPADMIEEGVEPMWPVPRRIPTDDYAIDTHARCQEEARFQGHRFRTDRQELLERADEEDGWRRGAIEGLNSGSQHDTRQSYRDGVDNTNRDVIELWEVWLASAKMGDFGKPEPTEKDGGAKYNGVIVTIADHQDSGGWIRDPRPYYGPPSGPYVLFGAYDVPEEPIPLSPLLGHRQQSIALNRVGASNVQSVMRYKRPIVVNDSDPDIAEKVQEVQHDDVLVLQGIDRSTIIPVELGGITPQMHAHEQLMREQLDRVSGLSDPAQGNTQSGETATAVAVAESVSAARDDQVKRRFHQGMAELFTLAAYLMWDNETVVFPLGEEADEALVGPEDPGIAWFQGSSMEGGFNDLQIEIEPYSMERSSGGVQMRRQMESDQMMLNTIPMMVQFPFVDWKEWWQRRSDLLNIPGGGELMDWEMLAEMQQLVLQMQIASAQPQGESGRMAGELGVSPAQGGGGRQPGQRGSAQSVLQGRETGANAGAASTA